VLDRIDAKAVHVRFADPIAVGCDGGIDDVRTDGVVIIGIVLEAGDVAVLVFRSAIEIAYLAAPMIPVFIAKFGGNRAVTPAEIPKGKNLIVELEERDSALVKPVVARMIDDDIENDTDGKWTAVQLEIVRGVD
jgi:hypothetical protein